MLCWGYWSLGQPGISTNLRGIVAEPQVYGFISDRSVKEVACGGNHSVFLLEDGEVYTCGLNTKGQLGHEREGNKPGECTSSILVTGGNSEERGWRVALVGRVPHQMLIFQGGPPLFGNSVSNLNLLIEN